MASSITLAGESLIAQKQASHQPLEITHFVLAHVPDLAPVAAVDRSAGLPPAEQIVGTYGYTQKGYLNPNQVVYSLMLGSDIGDFDWNWIGLKSAEGVLFAVSTVPVQQKRRNIPPLQTGNNVTRNFLVAFDGAQELTGITVEASTWQHDFTAALAQKLDRTQFVSITQVGLENDSPEKPFLLSESAEAIPLWADTNAAEKLAVVEVETLQAGDRGRKLANAEFVYHAVAGAVTSLNTDTVLTGAHKGLLLLDASADNVTITLPASTAQLGIRDLILRRTDNSGHLLVVQSSGTDRIKFHTHLRAEGYPFLVLMGAGDFWHLRSDGAGSWWPISRLDSTPPGRVTTETSIVIPPGGYGPAWGVEYNRLELPWLFDYAAQSWAWYTEEEWHLDKWGGWSSGDGVTTFRGPEVRGEFGRFLDEGRSVDVGREAGSFKADSVGPHQHPVTYWTYKDGTGTGSHNYVKPWNDPYSKTGNKDDGTGPNTGTETRPRSTPFPGRIKLI